MTTPSSISRQPKTIDLLQDNKFKLSIHKYPYLEYFCQTVNIPGIDIPEFIQPSTFTPIKRPGTVINYEDLEITFLVSEDLQNWLQLMDWMTRIVPTRSFNQVITPEKEVYSDITLHILSNKSNRVMEINFLQCWPKVLSAITMETTTIDAANVTATITFGHSGFTVLHKSYENQIPVS